ncbi:MAG TPA: carboxymuconolactone decarboxylase family protein [Candidatus Competibacteraceae bacterium]|nr:carboxymuconolactone decarboxylase family protein [Candidatus Competibacteraceae bacterium]MCP5132137.1 carboxymuconolactone decarboxylase family protein [Gammaproteobacteria bacterium]HPF58063.1 carboxymuconolactone decarboxylase family protein [Candidatus Competibacteraceae bacterium]HRY16761.1 carboxymuconolactone decarboxylase family protein [Candidatus Competibacteraceae bacterium]
MTRIQPIDHNTADPAAADLLHTVKKKMGSVPNLIATMAHSPAVAKAYLGFSQTLSSGFLPPRVREQIALVVGETNHCDYCLAAHTALGKAAGLSEQETRAARRAHSPVEKEQAALELARKIVQDRGMIADTQLGRVRQAGYTDGEIAEIVAHVALNIFTNYFNHVAGTAVDFPAAPSLAAA